MQKFSRYFNDWLYANNGYYTNYKSIGKEGDFYTSVSTSHFFGGSIGKKIVDTIQSGFLKKDTTIVEIGSHHGYLLADIIQFIYTLKPELLTGLTFAIVERFDALQQQQKKYLEESFGNAINVVFYKDISEVNLSCAFIVANEIFDAFSCELVHTKQNILQQAFVHNHTLQFLPCEDKTLIQHCKRYGITKGEVAVGYENFLHHLCNNIERFEFVTFDYGDSYPRNDFSTRMYAQHNVYPLFEENIKLEKFYQSSDITYDVHFQHLIDIFKKHGIKEIEYKTQLQALVDFGIIDLLEMLQNNVSQNVYLKETQKVKTLLEPTGMGERFKMLNIRKY